MTPDDDDGRRARGQRTRHAVAGEAAALASVRGLAGLTLSQVGAGLGVTKSSVQAAYPTKEALQLAAVEAATAVFVREVIAPGRAAEKGLPRVHALVDAWIAYIERRVLPGGCFLGSTIPEYDSHPGNVRTALADAKRSWLALLEQQVAIAQEAGDIPSEPTAAMRAFEIDALLAAGNVARNLADDTQPLEMARAIIHQRLK